jgi:predicted transport protein
VKGVKNRKKATFLVFWMTRSHLHLRIGIDPKSFEDPKQITKEYKGFFWARLPNTQERGFNIEPKRDLGYAITLIEQSYRRAKAI